MGYYQGDHYRRGDYYRGDPSFLSGLGALTKKAFSTALGFVPVVGPALKTAAAIGSGVIHPANRADVESALIANTATPGSALIPFIPQLSAKNPAVKPLVVASPLGTPVTPAAIQMQLAAMGHMRRTHPNRSTYVTRGGGTSRWPAQLQVHPKGTEAVTSRRMNVGNARALRRSIRRLSGFAKLAHRVLVIHKRFKKARRKK